MPYLGIFGLEFLKSCLRSAASNSSTLKILRQKQKCLNLGPKMLYMGIFGQEFQKTSVIFEISDLNFV